VFSEVTDDAQAAAALDAQSLAVFFPSGRPPRQAGAMSVPGWRIGYLALHTEKEPFNRPKVRHAVAAALDVVPISRAIGTSALPLQSLLPSGVWARRDARIALEGDAQGAKRLLAEGGFKKGVPPTLLVMNGSPG